MKKSLISACLALTLMMKFVILIVIIQSFFVHSSVFAQEPILSDVQNSGCLQESRRRQAYGEGHETIVLLKEGNILSVQLLNYVSVCGVEDFDVRPSVSGGTEGTPCSVSILVIPVGDSDEDCLCPYNISFSIHGLETNSFHFSCLWYDGEVSLTDGEPLRLGEEVDIYYDFDEMTHTARVKDGRACTGNLNIPSEVSHEGQTYTVTSIGAFAFINNMALTSVSIPNSVTSIGEYAFADSRNLTSLSIGSGVTRIDNLAFYNCTGLTDLFCYSEQVPSVGEDAFSGVSDATLHVPAVSIDLYKMTSPWKDFGNIVALPNPVAFTEGQMATIVLPTEPEASKGKYYRLDRVEGNEIIFEEEKQPKAHIPYIIVPGEDFSIELGTLDLKGLSRDTVSIDGVSFIGTYQKEEIENKEGFYIDLIDATPDCILSDNNLKVGALRAFLQVHWDDPYSHGGTKAPAEKMQIVLHDHGTGIREMKNEELRVKNGAAVIFDLSGRKVADGKKPIGIYIKDGRKTVKK